MITEPPLPAPTIARAACLTVRKTPSRLTAIILRQSWNDSSASGPKPLMPALATAISTRRVAQGTGEQLGDLGLVGYVACGRIRAIDLCGGRCRGVLRDVGD